MAAPKATKPALVAGDIGNTNARVIAEESTSGYKYAHFLSLLAPLAPRQWDIVKRVGVGGSIPPGFAIVNDVPYAYGYAARAYVSDARPEGAARYKAGYYDILYAIGVVETFLDKTPEQIAAAVMYPPRDYAFSGDQMNLLHRKKFHVQLRGIDVRFTVAAVTAFDEPYCAIGYMAFNRDGSPKKNNPLAGKKTLIVDPGGSSCDTATVGRDGTTELPLTTMGMGMNKVVSDFEAQLRAAFPSEFRTVTTFDPLFIFDALKTGKYVYGRRTLDCSEIADPLRETYTQNVVQVIEARGGVAGHELIGLTGGGGAFSYRSLVKAMPDAVIKLADDNLDMLFMANGYGAYRLLQMLRNAGDI